MAIKGKSKSRSRRAVTPGPRPAYVPVRKAWYARREVQVGVGILVLVAAVAGIWYGIAHSRTQARQREQDRLMRTAATTYKVQMDQALAGVGQALPPSGFQVLPILSTDLQGLRKGTVSAKAAGKDARTAATAAAAAARAVDAIDASGLVGGKGITDETFVLYVVNSKARIGDALKLLEDVAHLLGDATRVTGPQRTELLDRATSVLGVADSSFSDGYNDYVNAQGIAKIYQPTLPTGGSPIGGSPNGGGS